MAITVSFTGIESMETIAKELRRMANWYGKQTSAPAKKGKTAEEDEEEIKDEAENEDEIEDKVGKDDEEIEADFTADEKPKKGRPKKLTLDDVNDACKKAAGKTTRAKVLKVLEKKFEVSSVSDLEPAQYEDVIEALGELE